ncbi:glycogen synthase GlgA [Paenibacillus sp. GSMTC-2017]|uniref:glycogen synthase GlgA n=1 Tax=Paenibacillus sp. GSMTC-2017 TaxID=2794350 RepID=UPI0018D8839D|nr:glycogen synthase GlgA [Paenibacillus sp. GSMTC-2017]MBH5318102.1 glycogen synthase GlgA [Paenibacillus sp. GSMTC-2017]
MNILFATSEAVPLAKTGGLADVAGALPKALNKRGVDVRVVLPKYEDIAEQYLAYFETIAEFQVSFGWRNQYCGLQRGTIDGVTYYLIDNELYFKRRGLYGYGDDAERFVFFSFAVMEAVRYMDFHPNIVHCNDWQTGLIPFLLRTRYAFDPAWAYTKSVFTIHNLKYQGIFGIDLLKELTGAGDDLFVAESLEFYGAASCMKGGLVYADKLTTVSESYAQEIQTPYYGENLDSLLRYRAGDLVGIVNGIDEDLYDPMNDMALHTPYRNSISRKRKNKVDLQAELGLPQSSSIPLIGIVSRLVEQKGFDLIAATIDEVLEEDVQLVVLGAGETHYEQLFADVARRHPEKAVVWHGYSERMARRVYAGSDIFAMPSKFEPCGLSQLLALRYRSVPIVRETGGLKDTVQAYNEYTGEGNGFSFSNYNAHDYLYTVKRALACYNDEETWKKIVENGSRGDYSWDVSAKAYLNMYAQLLAHRKENERWPVIS